MNFEDMNVKPEIVRALKEQQITTPTMIQEKTIPLLKSGKDIIGISKTGSGKTIAFGVPLLERVQKGKGLQGIVLAPTRELAVQIAKDLKKCGKYLGLEIATVYGGVGYTPQIEALRKSEIAVATTGRFLDHLRQNAFSLKNVSCVVLDEADKMVDMGFIDDVNHILSQTPGSRQIILFGATIADEIDRLRQRHMRNPETVKAESHVKHDFLEQYYYNVRQHEKFSLLVHLLNKEDINRVIIFCSARKTVDVVAHNLKRQGFKVEMLHGKLTQNKREVVIDRFKKGSSILVASAVAARGLHIDNVSHVINYDLSQDPEEYIHRVGRTARAGESGKAITLLGDRDHDAFSSILNRFPIEVKLMQADTFSKIQFDMGSERGSRGSRPMRGARGEHPMGGRRGFSKSSGHSGFSDRGFSGRGYSHSEDGSNNRRPSWNNPTVRAV